MPIKPFVVAHVRAAPGQARAALGIACLLQGLGMRPSFADLSCDASPAAWTAAIDQALRTGAPALVVFSTGHAPIPVDHVVDLTPAAPPITIAAHAA